MMSNDLDDTSRSNLMAAMALLQRRRRTTGVTPSQLATDSGIPAMGALPDADYQMSPSAIASMMAHRDAAQAKQDKLPTIDDFTATPLLNSGPGALVKSQLARGGTDAENILRYQNNKTTFDWGRRFQRPGGAEAVYGGLKGITSADDLIANPAFQKISQADPTRAAKVYHDMTGGNFTMDMQAKQKQRTAMQTSWETSLQRGFEEGNYRRNPTMGWLERRVTIPNIDPTAAPQEFWKPVDATVHQADIDYGAKATGYSRNPTPADDIPMEHRNAFMEEYYNQKQGGKTDREALTAANSVANMRASIPSQLATLQTAPASASNPVATKGPMEGPPSPTAYPEQAAARAIANTGQQVLDWGWNNVPTTVANVGAGMANIGAMIPNTVTAGVNTVGAMFGAKSRIAPPLPAVPYTSNVNEDLDWLLSPERKIEERKAAAGFPTQMGTLPPATEDGFPFGMF